MNSRTILLRLSGPLQSWGTDSRFEIRRTETFPTKSGVIGLIANALGMERNEDLSELRKIRMSVRVEQPGVLLEEFQTAHPKDEKDTRITRRYYLCDAVFLCGIECDDLNLLEKIETALSHPKRPLYLGRRSCPPDFPFLIGSFDKPADLLLREYPWTGRGEKPDQAMIYSDALTGPVIRERMDDPVSFDVHYRMHKMKKMSMASISVPDPLEESDKAFQTEIDFFNVVSSEVEE